MPDVILSGRYYDNMVETVEMSDASKLFYDHGRP